MSTELATAEVSADIDWKEVRYILPKRLEKIASLGVSFPGEITEEICQAIQARFKAKPFPKEYMRVLFRLRGKSFLEEGDFAVINEMITYFRYKCPS